MTGPLTLALDAATVRGSVAVVQGTRVLAQREVGMRSEGAERLLPAVAAALAEAGVGVAELRRIVCGAGPGSFTGLRIAASIAKGLATARPVPLYGVSSLALLVAGAEPAPAPGTYLAVLDALRGDVFVAAVSVRMDVAVSPLEAPVLVSRSEVQDLAARLGALRAGPAEPLAWTPHARGVARMGAWLATVPPVDLASWEPVYGRLAEAQVKWERAHGRSLPAT